MTIHEGTLLFDSAQDEAMVGTRFGRRPDRTLLYRSESFNVDLLIHATSDGLRYFHGHVTREGEGTPVTGALVRLVDPIDTVTPDEYGQFAVSRLSAEGRATLLVAAGDADLVCEIPDAGAEGNA